MSDEKPNLDGKVVTKSQHFVPQFYLKRFADSQKFLHVLEVKKKELRPRRPYPSVCYDSYFYAARTGQQDDVSQQIEKWLQKIESYIAQRLTSIIDKILTNQQITGGDKYVLAVLFSMLWLRGPVRRKQINRLQEDMTRQIMKLSGGHMIDAYVASKGVDWSEEQIENLRQFYEKGEYSIESGNEQHLALMIDSLGFFDSGFSNLFCSQKWQIFIARGDRRFLASDNPVVEWFPPTTGFFGRAFPERDHCLALTPEILLYLTTPVGSAKVKRSTLFRDQDSTVMMYNFLIAEHSNKYVYSAERKILEDMLNGLEHPGEAEMLYYDRYHKPYRDHQ